MAATDRRILMWCLLLVLTGVAFLVFQPFPGLWDGFFWLWVPIGVGFVFASAPVVSRISAA